jgi:pentose-5-phosphate-3-epimerase
MIENPGKWVDDYAKAGATNFTFHIEAVEDCEQICNQIKSKNMKTGIAIKPKTELTERLFSLIEKKLVDFVLIMTVGNEYLCSLVIFRARIWRIVFYEGLITKSLITEKKVSNFGH